MNVIEKVVKKAVDKMDTENLRHNLNVSEKLVALRSELVLLSDKSDSTTADMLRQLYEDQLMVMYIKHRLRGPINSEKFGL